MLYIVENYFKRGDIQTTQKVNYSIAGIISVVKNDLIQ